MGLVERDGTVLIWSRTWWIEIPYIVESEPDAEGRTHHPRTRETNLRAGTVIRMRVRHNTSYYGKSLVTEWSESNDFTLPEAAPPSG